MRAPWAEFGSHAAPDPEGSQRNGHRHFSLFIETETACRPRFFNTSPYFPPLGFFKQAPPSSQPWRWGQRQNPGEVQNEFLLHESCHLNDRLLCPGRCWLPLNFAEGNRLRELHLGPSYRAGRRLSLKPPACPEYRWKTEAVTATRPTAIA